MTLRSSTLPSLLSTVLVTLLMASLAAHVLCMRLSVMGTTYGTNAVMNVDYRHPNVYYDTDTPEGC